MPKIIENLPQKLIAEDRRLAEEDGYQAVTVRAVATGCGVGVGTVYNYFSSKDDLLAAYLLEQWQDSVVRFTAVAETSDDPRTVLMAMYQEMTLFGQQHRDIFQHPEAVVAFLTPEGEYNALMMEHLMAPLRRFCPNDFSAGFIAQSFLHCTMYNVPFDMAWSMLERLF